MRDDTGSMVAPRSLDDTAREAFRTLRGTLDFGGAALLVREDDRLAVAATDPPVRFGPRATKTEQGHGLAGWVLEAAEPRYVPDLQGNPLGHGVLAEGLSPHARSYLGVPLIAHGRALGVLHLDAPEPDAFAPEDRGRVLNLAPEVAEAVYAAVPTAIHGTPPPAPSRVDPALGGLLSVVSHELRAPITSIRGLSETLATRADTMDRSLIEELARRISHAGVRLHRLVSDLLDVSTLERGTIPVRISPIAVEPVIRRVAAIPTVPPHEVHLDIEPGLPPALADPDRLEQVIDNLVANAAKFSPKEEPISVHARLEGDRVAIGVTDNGEGIPPEMHKRVFEPFTRGHAGGESDPGGVGIGLFIVRDICRAMDADVTLQSEVGVGTTVTVRLPARTE